MIKRVIDLRVRDILINVIAPGENVVSKLQYLKDNRRVRITATNGTTIVLDQFTEIEVKQ